jgi:hypothetical protein
LLPRSSAPPLCGNSAPMLTAPWLFCPFARGRQYYFKM